MIQSLNFCRFLLQKFQQMLKFSSEMTRTSKHFSLTKEHPEFSKTKFKMSLK